MSDSPTRSPTSSGVKVMAGTWKVRCWMKAPDASGNANGEFATMTDAVQFAESWLGPGWVGILTNPSGEKIDLEPGKPPRFPGKPKG
jgi:hypothetical protein